MNSMLLTIQEARGHSITYRRLAGEEEQLMALKGVERRCPQTASSPLLTATGSATLILIYA
jgi:hypothetical protein